MNWLSFGYDQQDQQDGPAEASERWVTRVMATEAQLAQQSGNTGGALDALTKLGIFEAESRRG